MTIRYDRHLGHRLGYINPAFTGLGYIGGYPAINPNMPDGRTYIMNEPASVDVYLFDSTSMEFVKKVKSRSDGTWAIKGIRLNNPFLVIFKTDQNYNAAVWDHILATPF